ncbi:MAG: (deoxy)nucleoside triphosphate pyrophosphohydrolase [Henriciella sp.]|nr:(deoxy)nucleoside triphosphate pyrophosphohydrolase [Henriciella sp.]
MAAALIDEKQRVLLAQRPEGKSMAGLWEFPGGKIEPGESPESALVRELNEELGIMVNANAIKPITFASHTYKTFHLLMPLFHVSEWEGSPEPAEGQQLQWVSAAALHTYPAPQADIPLFDVLVRYLKD